MKKKIILLFAIIGVIFISGCTNQTGNMVQSEGPTPAGLTQQECTQMVSGVFFVNFGEECKQFQIEYCHQSQIQEGLEGLLYIMECLKALAMEYSDEGICERIVAYSASSDNEIQSEIVNRFIRNTYWECRAETVQNPDLCLNIDDKEMMDRCSLNSGGESVFTVEDCKLEGYGLDEFEYYSEYCKPIQIEECKNTDESYYSYSITKADCFLDLAVNYDDEDLCVYVKLVAGEEDYSFIDTYGLSDIIYAKYWRCKAITTGDESYCKNIDSIAGYELCLSAL